MKQRIIKILKPALQEDCKVSPVALERAANMLIEAGCVVPKFGVGDKAFTLGGSEWEVEEVSPLIRYGMVDSSTHYFPEKELFATESESMTASEAKE